MTEPSGTSIETNCILPILSSWLMICHQHSLFWQVKLCKDDRYEPLLYPPIDIKSWCNETSWWPWIFLGIFGPKRTETRMKTVQSIRWNKFTVWKYWNAACLKDTYFGISHGPTPLKKSCFVTHHIKKNCVRCVIGNCTMGIYVGAGTMVLERRYQKIKRKREKDHKMVL